MLDRDVVEKFVLERLKENKILIPKDIKKKELVEAFCQFTEDDYYEWLRDNFGSFFNNYNPNWHWIKEYIDRRKREFLVFSSQPNKKT
jgi:hypothetical protein